MLLGACGGRQGLIGARWRTHPAGSGTADLAGGLCARGSTSHRSRLGAYMVTGRGEPHGIGRHAAVPYARRYWQCSAPTRPTQVSTTTHTSWSQVSVAPSTLPERFEHRRP